jgi:histidinol-phosphate aminotransferase
MDTPMPSNKDSLEPILKQFKPEVIKLPGYVAPPQGDVKVKLNQNENPYDLPSELKNEIFQAMQEKVWSRYPDYFNKELRENMAAYWNLKPEQILPSNGSNQLLYAIASAVITLGDWVLICPPTFSLVDLVFDIFQGKMVKVDQDERFSINEEEFLDSSSKIKLTFLCSPNNPTGKAIDLSFLEKFLRKTPGLVLWDEAYGEFWGKSAIPLLNQYPNLLILRTFSKAFGMAGLRVGFLLGHPSLLSEIQKVCVPYNLNQFSQTAALTLLNHTDWIQSHVQQILNEREFLFRELEQIDGITPVPSDANFILMKTPDASAVFNGLKSQGILVREVNSHSLLNNYLRVTVGKPEENKVFINTLKQIVSHL